MNYSDYRFTLDIQIHQAQVSIPVTFGDSARRLCIGLTDGRKPYTIGEGCIAVFNAKKPDGTSLKNSCIIERNAIIYEFTEQTTNCEGVVKCDLTLYGADGKILTSPQFIIVVDKKVVRDAEVPVSEGQATAISDMLTAEAYRQQNEDERIAEEKIRDTNENGRVAAESARQITFNNNEAERVSAEGLRATAEAERADAEAERADAEAERRSAETTRYLNEGARINAETQRAANEAERETAESGRVDAETARANAEAERRAEFDSAEATRKNTFETNEAARQAEFNTAEAERAAKFDKFDVVPVPGDSEDKAMSQKATTELVGEVKDFFQVGRNLYDKDEAIEGKMLQFHDNQWKVDDYYLTTAYIPVSVGDVLTVQRGASANRKIIPFGSVVAYDSNWNYLRDHSYAGVSSYTVPEDVAYIRASVAANSTDLAIVRGTEVLDYEPYKFTLKPKHRDDEHIKDIAKEEAEKASEEMARKSLSRFFQADTNLYDINRATKDKYLQHYNNQWKEDTYYSTSDYIPVSAGDVLTAQRGPVAKAFRQTLPFGSVVAYDDELNFLSEHSVSDAASYTVQSGVAYIRVSLATNSNNMAIVRGTEILDYEPYKPALKPEHHDTEYIKELARGVSPTDAHIQDLARGVSPTDDYIKDIAKEEAEKASEEAVVEAAKEAEKSLSSLFQVGKNLYDKEKAKLGHKLQYWNNLMVENSGFNTSDYIPVSAGDVLTVWRDIGSSTERQPLTFDMVTAYDSNLNFLGQNYGAAGVKEFEVLEGVAYIRATIAAASNRVAIVRGTTDIIPYEDYKLTLKSEHHDDEHIKDLARDVLATDDTVARKEELSRYAKLITTRNLLNVNFQQGWFNQTTGVFTTHTRKDIIAAPEYVAVEGGKNYTLSWAASKYEEYIYVYEYRADCSVIKFTMLPIATHGTLTTSYTMSFDAECAFIRVSIVRGGSTQNTTWEELILDKFQLEEGDVRTPYIPCSVIDTDDIDINGIAEKIPSVNFNYSAYGLPVLEFKGNTSGMNKENAVTLSYKYGEREGTCTLKWQGNSSLTFPKKNYTVKFDTKFEASEGWGKEKKYCLKANYIDFSHSRNICSAKLWGKVVKSRKPANETLKALPNGGAIDGFPICVVINGEYKGIYTFNIPKDGWMFGMGDGDAEAIVCADNTYAEACAFNGAATLDTLADGSSADFELEYAPDEDNAEWVKTSLNRLLEGCADCNSAEDFESKVAPYLDVESAIDYLIFATLICHHDGIVKNYILATYDGTKWLFSGYDMDSTFGISWNGADILRKNNTDLNTVTTRNNLFNLLKTYKADKIKARYNELVNGALSEETVIETFSNFIGSIPKALYDEEVKLWTSITSTSVNNLSQIIDFNRRRREHLDAQIEAL